MVKHFLRKFLRPLAFICIYVFLFSIVVFDVYANGDDVTLAWDPNPESDLAGYKLYWGTASHNYRESIDVGKVTEYTVYNLEEGQTYYFAATAYDLDDNESVYSNEVEYTVTLTVTNGDSGAGGGGGGGGCFIATAAYGSGIEPEVKILREFRDRYLLTSSVGSIFVNFYYTYSPPIAEIILNHSTIRLIVRWSLLPFVGLSWFMLNLGPITTLGLILLFLSGFIALVSVKRKLRRK